MTYTSIFLKKNIPHPVLSETSAAYILMYFYGSSSIFTALCSFQLKNKVLGLFFQLLATLNQSSGRTVADLCLS